MLLPPARKAALLAPVEPPTATARYSTILIIFPVVILVVGGEHHPGVSFPPDALIIPVAFILQCVAGVSAVSRHIQSIFVTELVTDLE